MDDFSRVMDSTDPKSSRARFIKSGRTKSEMCFGCPDDAVSSFASEKMAETGWRADDAVHRQRQSAGVILRLPRLARLYGGWRAAVLNLSYQRRLRGVDTFVHSAAFGGGLSSDAYAQIEDLHASLTCIRHALMVEVMVGFVKKTTWGEPRTLAQPRPMAVEKAYFAATKGRFDVGTFCSFVRNISGLSPLSAQEIDLLLPGALITWVLALSSCAGRLRLGDEAARSTGLKLIESISNISKCSLPSFVQTVCAVDGACRHGNDAVYTRMSFGTQQLYRYRIDEIALRHRQPSLRVARAAVGLARDYSGGGSHKDHVGFYLFRTGQDALHERLSSPEPGMPSAKVADDVPCAAAGAMSGPISVSWHRKMAILLSAYVVVSLLLVSPMYTLFGIQRPVTGILYWLSVLAVSINVVSRMRLMTLKRRCAFSMAFDAGVPEDCATVIAVSAMPRNEAEIDRLLQHLRDLHHRVADKHVDLALLADFPDSIAPGTTENERVLLDYLVDRVSKFRASADAGGTTTAFRPHLFFRHRAYSHAQRCYMGHERKRGKLDALNRMITTGTNDFDVVMASPLRISRWKYVVALDEDAVVMPACVQRMVAVLAHPLNSARSVEDIHEGTGYGIAVPAIALRRDSAQGWLWGSSLLHAVTPECKESYRTFTILGRSVELRYRINFDGSASCAGRASVPSRDFLYDELGECMFPGKGTVNPSVASAVLGRALPNDCILSHDTVEGAFLRPVFVPDAVIAEGFPHSYEDFCARRHRWLRGDWQNLALLFIGRLHVPSAERRSILQFTLLVQIAHSLSVVGMGLALVFACVMGDAEIRGLLAVLTILLLAPDFISSAASSASYCMAGFPGPDIGGPAVAFGKRIIMAVVQMALSLHQSAIAVDAIGTALWRIFRGKNLLEWREFRNGNAFRIANRIRASRYVSAATCGFLIAAKAHSTPDCSLSMVVLAVLGLSPLLAGTRLFTRPVKGPSV